MIGRLARTLAWAALVTVACLAGGAEPPPIDGVPPFHRTYIPRDEIQKRTWTNGYLPIDAAEFEQLLERVKAGAVGAPGPTTTVIQQAEFAAKIVGDDLLSGTCDLLLSEQSQTAASVLLDPCNVAVSQPVWEQEGGKPAVLGAGADGRLRLVVAGKKLHAHWALRGERTAAGAVVFHLQVPHCPMSRLTVDVPAGLELVASQGIVVQADASPSGSSVWTVDLGGHEQVDLRLVAADAARERRPLTLFRQNTAYELTPRGVNVVVQLKLDVHGEPLDRLALELDPGLRLVAARAGEAEIPWSSTVDRATGLTRAVLQLSEPIVGSGRAVQLSAIAPLETGVAWRLPAVRPQGLSWQEGTSQILVPSMFLLESLETKGCRQSRLTALPAPLSGETIEVQAFRPTATIDVVVSQPRERPTLSSGEIVELGTHELVGRCAVQLALLRGQRRAIQLALAPGWTVDAVENLDGTGALTWELDDSLPEHATIRISLPAPLSAARPVRLLVRGRKPLAEAGTIEGRHLRMLSIDGYRPGRQLISVRASEGAELRWTSSDELNRLDLRQLPAADVQLFPEPPGGQLLAADSWFDQSSLVVQRRRPAFTVDVRVDAAVQAGQLTETYAIQCQPDSARVERLLVHLSHPREVPLEWSLAGGNAGEFSARRISAAEQAQSGLPAGGEVWELNLQLSRPGAFELRAVRTSPFKDEVPLALASVADASTQRGTLAIRALGATGVSIKNRRLTPVPAELADAERYQTARGAFHYQPGRDDLGVEPAVSLAPGAPVASESGLWAWHQRLESRYGQSGDTLHFSVLQLQTAGRQQVRVWFPADARLLSVWVDDRRLAQLPNDLSQGLSVELPGGRAFASITASFTTPDRLPSLTARYSPPFPRLDGPVMAREWIVWLPPGYALWNGTGRMVRDASVAPTWSQRLFGILGRGPAAKVFNPLSPADWRASGTSTELSQQATQQFTQTLGEILLQYADFEALTWGQLLALCAEADTLTGRALLVDADGLEAAGITPRSRVRASSGVTPLERGQQALEQARLLLLAEGDSLVITSSLAAHSLGEQTVPIESEPGQTSLEALLAGELQRDAVGRFQAFATWLAAPSRPAPAWHMPTSGASFSDLPKWERNRLRLSATSDPHIRLADTAAMGSLAWAIFLGALGAGLCWRRLTSSALLGLLALAGFLALVVPPAFAALASATFWAATICLMARLCYLAPRQRRRSDASQGSQKPRTSVIGQLSRISLLAVLLGLPGNLAAQNVAAPAKSEANRPAAQPGATSSDAGAAPVAAPPAGTGAAPPALNRVFVPVDEMERPVGGKYYLSQQFYSQLVKRAAALADETNPWLITRANYLGALARDPASKRLAPGSWTARYELQVLRPRTIVRLPFAKDSKSLVTAARLDGRPLALRWSESAAELQIGPLEPDRYRLELDLKPALEADALVAGFELSVPPLPHATVDLTYPADGPMVELPSARGEVRVDKQRGTLTAELGAADRLALRWPVAAGMESPAPNLEVDELLWMRVRPGTTLLDARFKYRVLAGNVRRLSLLTDSRLRLLPSTSAQSIIADVHTIPGEPQRVEIELRKPVADEVAIDLSFLMTNASGVGNLRLPRLESVGARLSRRYLGVSVDGALQPRIQAGEDSRTLDIAEFVTAWGAGTDARPQAAYVVPRGEPVWVLSTQPNEARVTSEQSLQLSLGRTQALLQFEGQVAITGGHLLQINLQGPPGITVDKVSVVDEGLQRVARWTVGDDGRVTAFLNAPVDGRQRISVRGHLTFASSEELAAPYIEVRGADVKRRGLFIYRQPSVLVQLAESPNLHPLESESPSPPEGFGQLVGRYSVDSTQQPLSIEVTPNVPQVRAAAAVFVERDAENWIAELQCQLQVSAGVLDAVHIEIPPQWSEPFRVDAPFKIVPLPGEQRRELIVTPDKAVTDSLLLRIRGRIAPSAGDRLRVPDVRLLGVDQQERFLVLPQQVDAQQITWEILGLTPATLPAEFAGRRPRQSSVTYQVAGDRFQATLKAVERAVAAARVALADIQIVWQGDGACEGVAAFDIEPGGVSHCVLELPDDSRLLHAVIEGVPAQVTQQGPHRWRLAFQSTRLPQHLEVIYQGPYAASGESRRFAAPTLEGIPVGQTLWTIYSGQQNGLGEPASPAASSSAARHELQRLTAITGLVRLPPETIAEHLPQEIARWYRPWRARYEHARGALSWLLVATQQNNTQSEEAIQASRFDGQLETVDKRLGAGSGRKYPMTAETTRKDLLTGSRRGLLPTYAVTPDAASQLTLHYRPVAGDSAAPRWALALAMLATIGGGAYALGRRPLPMFALWFVIGAVGIAWWLLLSPSAPGLVLIVIACLLAVRARWQPGMRFPSTGVESGA